MCEKATRTAMRTGAFSERREPSSSVFYRRCAADTGRVDLRSRAARRQTCDYRTADAMKEWFLAFLEILSIFLRGVGDGI